MPRASSDSRSALPAPARTTGRTKDPAATLIPEAQVNERQVNERQARSEAQALALLPEAELLAFVESACRSLDRPALERTLRAYLLHRAATRRALSAHTESAYLAGLHLYLDWVAASGSSLLDAPRHAGTQYLAALQRPDARQRAARPGRGGYAPATRQKLLAGARALHAALRWAGAVHADPFAELQVASDPTPAIVRHPPYATEVINEVLASLSDPFVRTALLLAAHGGLRAQEALSLEWAALERRDGQVFLLVHGKGDKARRVPASGALRQELESLERQRQRPGYVLPFERYWDASRPLQRAFKARGFEWRGLHALRKSAATRLYQATDDVFRVSAFLGHASDRTTRSYVQVDLNLTAKALEDF